MLITIIIIFFSEDQLEVVGAFYVHYISEPCPRNTVSAIALTTITLVVEYVCEYIYPNSTLLVLFSDHSLTDYDDFKNTVEAAVNFTEKNKLVSFGIEPHSPKTDYS